MADGFPPYYQINPQRAMMMVPFRPPPTVAAPNKWLFISKQNKTKLKIFVSVQVFGI
jgi:hypothetical protein